MQILDIRSHPELISKAARWFSQKWSVPEEAYRESMLEAIDSDSGVPAWYVVLSETHEIVAGLGTIDNDFHQRKDLTPNICAVFVMEAFRHQGLARKLLNHACDQLAKHGIDTCYLITEHTDFYEHCGWSFYGMIPEDGGHLTRCYWKKLN